MRGDDANKPVGVNDRVDIIIFQVAALIGPFIFSLQILSDVARNCANNIDVKDFAKNAQIDYAKGIRFQDACDRSGGLQGRVSLHRRLTQTTFACGTKMVPTNVLLAKNRKLPKGNTIQAMTLRTRRHFRDADQ